MPELPSDTPEKLPIHAGPVPCPLGKRCKASRFLHASPLVYCTLESGETCAKQMEVSGDKFCRIYMYPTNPWR